MTASEQARADALADAETLRLFMDYSCSMYAIHGPGSLDARPAIKFPDDAFRFATAAASAAFRAVPGLRGDR